MDFILAALLLVNISVTASLYCKLCMPSKKERTDAAVEEALQRNTIEEGFENIMTYSVMGKTGFEELK